MRPFPILGRQPLRLRIRNGLGWPFAKRLGLRAEWLQKPGTSDAHFDLVPTKHAKAITLGAKLLTRAEFYALRKRKRAGNVLIVPESQRDPEEFRQEYLGSFDGVDADRHPRNRPGQQRHNQWD